MAEKKLIRLSVHDLVDPLLREGDIDNRIYNQETMNLGSKIHSSFQQKQGNEYLSEVFLSHDFEIRDYTIRLEGRADGIIVGDKLPIIDEIKSTVSSLEDFYQEQNKWHFGQAECYALMYLLRENLDACIIRLTYISQQQFDTRMVKEKKFTISKLQEDINQLLESFIFNYESLSIHTRARNESAKNLKFPYAAYRKGQKEMAKYAFSIAKNGGILFLEAPTGIGKTISAIFPALKSFADTDNAKIFYLTAKTSGRLSCFDAMTQCYKNGFIGRDSLLVAKEKLCFSPGKNCNPDECEYARDYYGKLRQILENERKKVNRYDSETIISIAKEYGVCPFELQLDLSLLSDVIICDYNYFFDPIVKLERYFSDEVDSSKYVILIDEAHNLPSRSRDMYSETLRLSDLKEAKKELSDPSHKSIKSALGRLIKSIEKLRSDEDFKKYEVVDEDILNRMEKFRDSAKQGDDDNKAPFPKSLKEVSRKIYRLLFLIENASLNATFYTLKKEKDFEIHFQSIDPTPYLSDCFNKVKGAVIFSATLSPLSFYMESIAGDASLPYLALPSPFPAKNFHLMVAPKISTKYKNRDNTYADVGLYLKEFVAGKKGNYFIYFPSYEYLDKIRKFLDFGDADVYSQEKEMTDTEREIFLSKFSLSPTKTTIGLLIIGGALSEGVDLPDERLIGVAVVGIGLPQISKELDLIRSYYDEKDKNGFKYAYMNPGMNKVMQAVGRVIRSENDVGAALLIDDRYLQNDYRELFTRTWNGYEIVTSPEDIKKSLHSFYNNKMK